MWVVWRVSLPAVVKVSLSVAWSVACLVLGLADYLVAF